MIQKTMHNNPEHLEMLYKKPYAEIVERARENLVKAGCPKEDIDFVINYGGIYQAYENDLDCFKKFPTHAVMYLTED